MRLPGLNPRQCRALLALLESSRGLSPAELAIAIGNYSTNTIASLEHQRLVRHAGDVDHYDLTADGHAIAQALAVLHPRRDAAHRVTEVEAR